MTIIVECLGERIADAAPTLEQVLRTLIVRICERDPDLDLAELERIVVAEDYPAALRAMCRDTHSAGVVRAVHHEDSAELLIDGAHMSAALAGDGEQVAAFVHLVHLELWRLHDARARLGGSPALELLLESEFDRHLLPIAESMWGEYLSARRAVWSLAAGSDLMLGHLSELIDALPAAMHEEIVLHLGSGDLSGLFVRSLGRITHLLQAMAHCQGCLAGLQRTLASVGPEYDQQLQSSPLAEVWRDTKDRLDRLHEERERTTERVYISLRPQVQATFGCLGLTLRRAEDGGVWLEPLAQPGSAPRH